MHLLLWYCVYMYNVQCIFIIPFEYSNSDHEMIKDVPQACITYLIVE